MYQIVSKTPKCPFFKKPCIEHDCMMYTHVTMTDPQTGIAKDEWTCCIPLSCALHVESTKQMRGVQAAVESFRNETIERQDALNTTLVATQIMPALNGMKDIKKLIE
jgi:hypothetical protein